MKNPFEWPESIQKYPFQLKLNFRAIPSQKSEKIFFNISPNHIDKVDMIKEITNKTTFAKPEMLVPFIPYVMPIPSESILLESARAKELSNIKTPPKSIICRKKKVVITIFL